MNESSVKIWRPAVESTDAVVPLPGVSGVQHQLYTKTSLAAKQNDFNSRSSSLNREILVASQAYNNTPKPFTKQQTLPANVQQVQIASEATREYTVNRAAELQQAKLNSFRESNKIEGAQSSQQSRKLPEIRSPTQPPAEEENMAPKLVHKQYNSPIDLYSMNNIRKTIEAHTEMIAPGLKGINFMKADTPVNKQSEVYKLVMEEERQRSSSRSGVQRQSPISGQPVSLPTSQASSSVVHSTSHVEERQQQQRQPIQVQVQHPFDERQQQVKGPVCCECGLAIIGPFARIGNRAVHPQCFNCTTCGTSLKNTGYFTVNEKLYCEIHAKQVANMMNIRYDFAAGQRSGSAPKEVPDQPASMQQQSVVDAISRQSNRGDQLFRPSTISPATISTMFADRSNSQASGSPNDRQDARCSWRQSSSKSEASSSTMRGISSLCTSSNQQRGHEARSLNQASTASSSSRQQLPLSARDSGRLIVQQHELPIVGDRVPVCVHCHVQIHGPYIMAGKTTWCKQCSQTNFNCNSCSRSLLAIGFIEDSSHKYFCEHCFEAYYAPICSKCNIRIKGDCLNALGKQWHPSCFVCGHCRRPFGNSSFYLEDNVPYCERDWNALFTTKCFTCSYPIQAGDKWIEALDRDYHSGCFRCTSCQSNLEGSTFYCKGGKPYCRLHAR